MKILMLLILTLIFTIPAFALPVVNVNVAPPGFENRVVWRDHLSPSHFYILPRGFKREDYFRWGFELEKNVMRISFEQDFDMDNLYELQHQLFKQATPPYYPSYSEVKFEDFNLNLGSMMDDFVKKQNCWDYVDTMIAHVEYDSDNIYVHCTFDLNEIGMNELLPFLKKGKFLALSVTTKMKGMKQLPDGTYEPVTIEMGFPAKLDSPAN